MPTGGVTTYTYDVVGNLTQKVDPNNRTTQYTYDADNREITEKWLPAGGGAATYTMTLAYDANGNVASVQDNFSHYAYAYDAVNRVTSIDNTGTPGSPRVTLTYGYDKNGNRTSLGDSLGGTDSYAYDARNQLDLVSQAGTSSSGVAPELVFFHHDQAGNRTSQSRYADLAANTRVATTSSVYDAANRLTSLTHVNSGGATIASYGYTLDAANRLTSEAHAWNGGNSTDTIAYGYTNNDQLTAVNHTNSSFANESFSYDTNGNRNASGQTTSTGNQIQSDGTSNSTYDAAGNLATKTTIATGVKTVYQWDYRNRLTEVDRVAGGTTTVVARFTYDALNRQIAEVDNPNSSATTRRTVYDGQTPLLDFNGSGQQTARYLSIPGAIDELLARQTASGVAWYLDDRLGSVREIVDNSGVVLDHVDYGVYGQVAAESAPAQGDRFKFAGMEYDLAISQYYDRARYYDPAAGRFISLDLIGFSGEDANEYRYVGNNVQNYYDLEGLAKNLPKFPVDDVGKLKGTAKEKKQKLGGISIADIEADCERASDLLEALYYSLLQRINEQNRYPKGGGTNWQEHEDQINAELNGYNQLLDNWTRSSCGGKGKPPFTKRNPPQLLGPSIRAPRPGDGPMPNPFTDPQNPFGPAEPGFIFPRIGNPVGNPVPNPQDPRVSPPINVPPSRTGPGTIPMPPRLPIAASA